MPQILVLVLFVSNVLQPSCPPANSYSFHIRKLKHYLCISPTVTRYFLIATRLMVWKYVHSYPSSELSSGEFFISVFIHLTLSELMRCSGSEADSLLPRSEEELHASLSQLALGLTPGQSEESQWKFSYISGQILCRQGTGKSNFYLLMKVKGLAVPLPFLRGSPF